jgi:peptidoglycan/LPS O-acetylase OafA/YrhL
MTSQQVENSLNTSLLASVGSNKLSLVAFDGLRGMGSLLVLIGHILTFFTPLWSVLEGHEKSSRYPLIGLDYCSAVTLFIVLSGFTLVYVYEQPAKGDILSTWEQKKEFGRKRIARLAPVYYLGCFIGIVPLLYYYNIFQVVSSLILTPLWLQSLTIVGMSLNGPLWTVSCLAFCYLSFPYLLTHLRPLSDGQLKARLLMCWAPMAVLSILLGVANIMELLVICHLFFPCRYGQFAMGVIAGLLSKRDGLKYPTFYAEFCSFILLLNNVICIVVTYNNYKNWFRYQMTAEFTLAIVYALWISALAHEECRGPTRYVLTLKPFAWLGQISYALYCLHFPILNWIGWVVKNKGVSAKAVPWHTFDDIFEGWYSLPGWSMPLVVLFIILCSACANAILERPARAAINKVTHNEISSPIIPFPKDNERC